MAEEKYTKSFLDNLSLTGEDSNKFRETTTDLQNLLNETNKIESRYAEELSKLKLRNAERQAERERELMLNTFNARIKQEEAIKDALSKNLQIREDAETKFQERLTEKIIANNLALTKQRKNEILSEINFKWDNERKRALKETVDDDKARKARLAEIQKKEEKERKEKLAKAIADHKITQKELDKLDKLERAERKKQAKADLDERVKNIKNIMKNEGIVSGVRKVFERDENGESHALENTIALLGSAVKALEKQVDEIGGYKGKIDTRLQGSKNDTFLGSYWDRMSKDITGVAMMSPLVKQSAIIQNISQMVDKGIAYNVEQRAFLATIKDKIAGTFNAFDSTLLRLVRIQQQDSTAARLGMESALNSFLNNMYETSEYLSDVASSVRGSLQEAEALMGAADATAFEYQVQKWLGSLYSTGMSQNAVGSIASAIGKLASGDISDFNGNGVGNLVIMSANQAGLSISDLLAKGLDESSTNKLMQAMVSYLAGLYTSSQDNLVVQQQLAKVYGVTAADLRAATNIADKTSITNIASNYLGYGDAINQLSRMAGSMYSRSSVGELIGNTWDNFKYTMAAGIANNPITYSVFKGANLIDGLLGGAEFSIPLVFGSGTTQTFNIADIMRIGALGSSIFSAISSLGSIGTGFDGRQMLSALGVNNASTVQRGTGDFAKVNSGLTVSSSGYVGNSSGSDVYNKYTGDTTAEQQQKVIQAQESSDETTIETVDTHVVDIYNLLRSVVNGSANIHVKVNDYGLTSWN